MFFQYAGKGQKLGLRGRAVSIFGFAAFLGRYFLLTEVRIEGAWLWVFFLFCGVFGAILSPERIEGKGRIENVEKAETAVFAWRKADVDKRRLLF